MTTMPRAAIRAAWIVALLLSLSTGPTMAQDCATFCGMGVEDCISADNGENCAQCAFPGFENQLYLRDTDGDGYGECKFCSLCDADEYIKTPCSGFDDNVCETCSECGDGETEAEACTATSDTVCESEPAEEIPAEETPAEETPAENVGPAVDCSACPEGEYLSAECNEDDAEDRVCTGCSSCDDDEYVKAACSLSEDTKCASCSECGDGEVEVEACTGTSDTVCAPEEEDEEPVDCSDCPDGEFLVAACSEDEGKGRFCGSCEVSCGSGVSDCIGDGSGQALCSECNFGPGIFSEDPDGDGYGACATCTECGSGEWLRTACSGSEDSECVACSSCGESELMVSACSYSADVVCEAVEVPNEEEEDEGIVAAEPEEETPADETPAEDVLSPAVDCSACPEGEYLSSECNEDDVEDRVCTGCSSCDDDEYVKAACSLSKDTECASCSECGDGEVEVESCTGTSDTVCAPEEEEEEPVDCSDCPDGEFLVAACSEDEGTGRFCGSCEVSCGSGVSDCIGDGSGQALCSECNFGPGIFSEDPDGDGYGACATCTECGSGEWLRTACSGSEDSECVACSSCGDGEVLASACSATADAVCEAVEETEEETEEEEAEAEEEDAAAVPSVDCSACQDGEFLVSECNEDEGEDRVCRACSERCGQGVTDCVADGNGDAACAECNFPGFELYAEDEDGDGYGECKFCSPCDDDEYVKVACSGFEDNECSKCSECEDGEVEVEACTAKADTVCSAPAAEEEAEEETAEEGEAGEDVVLVTPDEPLITKSVREDGTLQLTVAAGEALNEHYRVAFVYKGDHYDSGDLSSPRCSGPKADPGETAGVEDAPFVLNFDSDWTALAVRLCPKEEDGDLEETSTTRAIYSGCSCYAIQYASVPCDPETGALAQCEYCSHCTDGKEGSMAQCRGGGEGDCKTCGGEGAELSPTDGEYGTCAFSSGGAAGEGGETGIVPCENACEEGYFIATPCDAENAVVCQKCTSCESDDDDDNDLFETKECSSTALEGGDRVCGEVVDAPFPVAQQVVDGDDIRVSLTLPDGLSFEDFYIVYRIKETDDPSDVSKPSCDDDDESDDGGAIKDGDDTIKLDADKIWAIAAATCPEDDDKGYKRSNTMKFAVISCSCSDGEYVSSPCDDGQPAECKTCSDVCPSGQYISAECGEDVDIKCKPCSGPCGEGEVEIMACGAKEDRVCLAEDEAVAEPPVVDSSETFFDDDSKIHLFLTLPKPLSFDDYKIAYVWVADTEENAPEVSCDEAQDSITFSDETIELVADDGWLVLSALTCPRSHVPFRKSEVYTYDISACSCPGGYFVDEPCIPGEQIRDCQACSTCEESETEISPCQGTSDRICEASGGSGAGAAGQLEVPVVTQVWTDNDELEVTVAGSDSDSGEVRYMLWTISGAAGLAEANGAVLSCEAMNSAVEGATESGAVSAGDSESFTFSTNTVVLVRAVACPAGLASGIVQPSDEVTMEIGLCACAPGKGMTSPCSKTTKEPASCEVCGDGFFLDEAGPACVACSASCASGSFMTATCTAVSDISCQPCSECGDGEVETAACAADSDTVCAINGTPSPNVVVSVMDTGALEAGEPPMQAIVQLPLGYPSSEWYVKYNAQVADEYGDPEGTLAAPVCDGEPSPEAVGAVNKLWNADYGYGWLLVRAVTCPVGASGQLEPSAVISEAHSICSCADGQHPIASCDIFEGQKAQCEACPDSGCPLAVKPPLLSQRSAIATGETGVVKLFAGPDAIVAYTTDRDLAVSEDPCSSGDLEKSSGPIAVLSLPVGTNFLRAVSCPRDEEAPTVFSYMLSAAVTVHPEYAPAEDDEDARLSASSIIELNPSAINNVLGDDTAADYISLTWSKFAQAGVDAAGISGTAVVTGVNEVVVVTSPFRRLAQAGAGGDTRYKIDYEVITTASEAVVFKEFLEKELVPEADTEAMTTLSQLLGGAKLVQQDTDVQCSAEASKACEVQWASNSGNCIADPLADVSCGNVKQGFIISQPGPCGAPCPASCTEGLSCTEVTPCEECECSGSCGTKYAVAQEGPEETDMVVDDGLREQVDGDDEPLTGQWWLWVAVSGGIILILAVAVVAAVLTVRARKRAAEGDNADDPQNFVFSSVYEEPRGTGGKGAANLDGYGTANEGEVHVTVNTGDRRSTGDGSLEIYSDSEMSTGDAVSSRHDML